jgi:hypothetical protein
VVPVCEVASCQRIKFVECDTVLAETGEELWLYRSVESIVDALVCYWFDPAISVTELTYLGDFPRSIVAYSEAVELAYVFTSVN